MAALPLLCSADDIQHCQLCAFLLDQSFLPEHRLLSTTSKMQQFIFSNSYNSGTNQQLEDLSISYHSQFHLMSHQT